MAVSKLVKKTKTITFAELCGDAKPIIKSAPASAKIKELAEGNGPGTEDPNFIHEKKGNIKFFDSDAKDTHKVAFTPLGGNYLGIFKLGTVNQKTDNIPWSFKVKDGVIDTLGEGQTLTQKYRVTITDSQGNKVSQIVTIKIEGTNDAPTITSPEQKASVVELTDANPNENNFLHEKGGAVTFNDVDKIDKHTATVTPQAGSYIGTFAIGSVSQATDTIPWTFKIDDAILEGLSEKDVIVQKYDVTVSDGKGGFATQTVTITITGTDDPLGFNGLALQGADVTVYEAGLVDGSTPGDAGAPITKSGFFNIFAGDDVGSLTIAGVTVISGGAVVPAALNVPIATTYGALTITAINLSTGQVSYSYTLLDSTLDHGPANNGSNGVFEDIALVLTDEDGDIATETLAITVIDDVPDAKDDGSFAIPEDAPFTYDVLANDVKGADQTTTVVAAIVQTAGAGTVTFLANGNVTFDPAPGFSGEAKILYTIQDGDGDQDQAVLTVVVDRDSVPQIGVVWNAFVDEDGFGSANSDALTPRSDETPGTNLLTDTGTIAVNFGNDAPAAPLNAIALLDTIALDGQLTARDGQPVTFALSGGALVGSANGVEVIRIAITGATPDVGGNVSYEYTVTLSQPVQHAAGAVENTAILSGITFQVTDSDGSVATASFSATILDDVPSIVASGAAVPTLVVDETNLTTNATTSFASLFTPSFGADGAKDADNNGVIDADATVYALNVLAPNSNSGLIDTATGNAVLLNVVGGVVVGSINGGATTVFQISVDANTGAVTLDQVRAVVHSANPDPSEASSPIAANLISITATITDDDGDTSAASVDIGGAFVFRDDNPSVTLAVAADANILLTTQDAETIGALTDTASASFASLFTATPTYGADGAGSTVTNYALSLIGASGGDSGLDSDGAQINLFSVGGVIYGSTTTNPANAVANAVFSIAVNSATGNVTLSQIREIDHSLPGATSNFDTQLATLANNLVRLTATAVTTDGDGDTATASQTVDLGGNIRFADDGPSVTLAVASDANILLTTQDAETIGALTDTASASFASLFTATPTYGADGAGSTAVSYALSLIGASGGDSGLDSDGAQINLFEIGGVIYGSTTTNPANAVANAVFSIAVNSATGNVTLSQLREIDHALPGATSNFDTQLATLANNLVRLTATAVTTDGDGDTATASQTVDLGGNIRFADDGPTAGAVSKTLDEATAVNSNIMLLLDVSGSMNNASGLTGLTRLDVLKASVIELLEQYDGIGDVAVRIVTFSSNANEVGGGWLSVSAAKAAVQALTAGGLTNYDETLSDAVSAFSTGGKLAGAQNLAYFISDGEPTAPSGSEGISASEQATWETFLKNNDVVSYALGIGPSVPVGALAPIAYNGLLEADNSPIVVTDLSQLAATLVGTVTGATTTGNLLTEGPGSFGADGGYVRSVLIGGKTFTYNPVTDAITVSGAGTATHTFNTVTNEISIASPIGGVLVLDLDNGAYTYTGPASVSSNQSDVFTYTLSDGDGDTASSTLTATIINSDRPPIVRDDAILTNAGSPFDIPDYALLYNDADPDGQAIGITSVTPGVGGTTADNAGFITFTDPTPLGGSFQYTGSTTAPAASDTADVTITRVANGTSTLNGNGLSNIIISGANGDTLNGYEGDDVLIGNGGNDSIFGGAGNDLIVGGAGNDTLNGGAGNDRFLFNVSIATAGIDTIQDFGANGQDKIWLDNAFFAALTTDGPLSAANFVSNASGTATNASQFIIFDNDGGQLYYDADGNGVGARVQIATLTLGGITGGAAAVDFSDFLII